MNTFVRTFFFWDTLYVVHGQENLQYAFGLCRPHVKQSMSQNSYELVLNVPASQIIYIKPTDKVMTVLRMYRTNFIGSCFDSKYMSEAKYTQVFLPI